MVKKVSLAATRGPALRRPIPDAPLPTHVAIIMDGNGRWAEQRRLPRWEGHRAGTTNIQRVIRAFAAHKIPFVTVYAFSTENWTRPDQEVQALMGILGDVVAEQAEELNRQGVRLQHLGTLDRLPPRLQRAIAGALDLTRNNSRLTLSVAFDYGGRAEILDAVRRIIADGVRPEHADESLLARYLSSSHLPDPDLIIRTAGEMRLSNFLLWQSAYSEYYCTNVLWPDFGPRHVAAALAAYQQRQRRFGGLRHPASQPPSKNPAGELPAMKNLGGTNGR
ncbi:MAG: di-trans,poly-cis-decaprenylcistransferase [Dehalococcoidia bacterium]|nr:di-trans,poly-cis-decaprenylcistransferase [Dehalococcoidia bacterium]